jgi:nucleotide-binding universal stress UspA family protein
VLTGINRRLRPVEPGGFAPSTRHSATREKVAGLDPRAAAELFIANRDTIAALRSEVQQLFDELAIDGEFLVREGDPAKAIEDVAASQRLDAILVGRSRSRHRFTLGSVPARLLRVAQRPIAIVP